MTLSSAAVGPAAKNRYRLPGIEREGIAQLSLLETALWPLQGGKLPTPRYETAYRFTTARGQDTARVTVRSAMGLQPVDEYVLWGLLGTTLRRSNSEPLLLATPYWMLQQLGMDTGGSQYSVLRESLLRLSTTSYQNTGFYNPETQEHEYVAFQFLSMLLPTVGGAGRIVDNERCWRIEWTPAFFRFCKATGGNLLFDMELYRELSPAARRLFLKLKDRFWRSSRVFLNVDDLTINGLGFSAKRPLYKRKFDLTNCIRELLDRQIISLGRGQSDPKELFSKRSKGCYVIVCYPGDYFRQPLGKRAISQKNVITDDPLFEPLRKIGVDAAGIRRLLSEFSRGTINRWVKITDAAIHEKPGGFPGFKVSSAAFLIDGIQNNRTPPDWMYSHEKRQEREQWERDKSAFAESEQAMRDEYERVRAEAFANFRDSPEGQQAFDKTYPILLEFHRVHHPGNAYEAARQATLVRLERTHFQFPDFAMWALNRGQSDASSTAM